MVSPGSGIQPWNVGKTGGDFKLLKTPANVFFAVKLKYWCLVDINVTFQGLFSFIELFESPPITQ